MSQSADTLPATIEDALQPSEESRIITEPNEPYRIIHVNEVWCRTCGFDAEEVLGQTCKFLQGPGTCGSTLGILKQALQLKRGLAVQLLNYTKFGRPFMNTLQVAPLYSPDGQVTHYLGVVKARYLDGGAVPSRVQQHGQASRHVHSTARGGDLGTTRHGASDALAMGGAGLSALSLGTLGLGGLGGELVPRDDPMDADFGDEGGVVEEFPAGASRVPPFLTKLTEIVTVEPPDIVRIDYDKPTFTIFDPARFAREVLPKYFKHNKLGSFYQQLHTYGFRRTGCQLEPAIEFNHELYSGSPADLAEWIRQGGAISKRSSLPREPSAAPPPQLLHDMLQVLEGTRQLAMYFQQAKEMHALQLRTILQKLMLRGMLAPESATYISSLPPTTPMATTPLFTAAAISGGPPTLGSSLACNPSCSCGGGAATSPPCSVTIAGSAGAPPPQSFPQSLSTLGALPTNGLQAQLDALESGIFAPLAVGEGPPSPSPNDSVSATASAENLHGEDALNLFSGSGYPSDTSGKLPGEETKD